MSFLQEAIQGARFTALNILGRPFRTTFFPKDKIMRIEGGEHVIEEEDYMVLFDKRGLFPSRTIIIDKEGRKRRFHEVIPEGKEDMAGQEVIIFQR